MDLKFFIINVEDILQKNVVNLTTVLENFKFDIENRLYVYIL